MPTTTDSVTVYGVSPDNDESLIISGQTAKADSVVIPIRPQRTHLFLSVVQYDASGDICVATAGSYAVEVLSWCSQQYEDPPTATIPADVPITVDWSVPTAGVRVTPTGITGDPVTYEVRVAVARS